MAEPDDVLAVLRDPRFAVPEAPTGGAPGTLRWLRGAVARFSNGEMHTRRRGYATAELDRMDPPELRSRAAQRSAEVLRAADGRAVDVMAELARTVPVGVLAEELGRTDPSIVDAVATVAAGYLSGAGGSGTDHAVRRLVDAFGGTPDEETAARIGLLVQACEATAGLIGSAAYAMLRRGTTEVDAAIDEVLRDNPPVRATRRIDVASGTAVQLDLARAGLTFGAGPRPCPGRDHAIAMAAGVLEALRGYRLLEPDVDYGQSVPLRLVVRVA
ncbi:MAG TPA: cytochrome P450 [Micromonosporaceae bacterium]|nr:cytochrome P450 [Micromonosporaceae bacterium]